MLRFSQLFVLGLVLGSALLCFGAEKASAIPPIPLPKVIVTAFAPLRKVADFRMLHPRAGCAVVVDGERLYLIGGQGSDGELLASVEEFNVRTGQSREFAQLATPRFRHRAALVGDKIYVIGGESRRSVPGGFDAPRSAMEATGEQRLLGSDDYPPGIELDFTVEIIDLPTAKVSAGPSLRDATSNFGCAAIDDKIYVMGGKHLKSSAKSRTNRSYVLDLKTQQWTEGIPMPTPRETTAVVVTGPFIVLPGGYNGTRALSVLEAFNPRTGAWASVTPLCQSISATAPVFLGHFLFLFGDYDAPSEIMAYDLKTKASELITPDYRAARDAAAVVCSNRIWVVGGKTLADSDPTNLIQVFELTGQEKQP